MDDGEGVTSACFRPPVGIGGIDSFDSVMLPPRSIFGIRRFNSPQILGTAFAIAPEVCITAGHVVLNKEGKFTESFRLVPLDPAPYESMDIPDGHVIYRNSPIIDTVTGYPGTDLVMFSVVPRAGWPAPSFDPLALRGCLNSLGW